MVSRRTEASARPSLPRGRWPAGVASAAGAPAPGLRSADAPRASPLPPRSAGARDHPPPGLQRDSAAMHSDPGSAARFAFQQKIQVLGTEEALVKADLVVAQAGAGMRMGNEPPDDLVAGRAAPRQQLGEELLEARPFILGEKKGGTALMAAGDGMPGPDPVGAAGDLAEQRASHAERNRPRAASADSRRIDSSASGHTIRQSAPAASQLKSLPEASKRTRWAGTPKAISVAGGQGPQRVTVYRRVLHPAQPSESKEAGIRQACGSGTRCRRRRRWPYRACAHKLRSFLTLMGVIIGVGSVVLVGAAIEGWAITPSRPPRRSSAARVFRSGSSCNAGGCPGASGSRSSDITGRCVKRITSICG